METCTAGSASGLEKRTSGNADTALQADSTYEASPCRSARDLAGRQARSDLHGPDHLRLCRT